MMMMMDLETFCYRLVKEFFSFQSNNDNDRIRFLINLIESACLLRQLRNFHGLQLMIGAIQSPRLYFDHQYYWRLLQQTYPIHYRYVSFF